MSEPLLLITVQSQRLLVDARMVREVLGEVTWIAIPGTRLELPGVVGWGRRAVAMLDLARLFPGLHHLMPDERRPRMLMLEIGTSHLAIPADSVSAVMDIDASNMRPRTLTDFALCKHEVHLDTDVVPLLDPSMLFIGEENF